MLVQAEADWRLCWVKPWTSLHHISRGMTPTGWYTCDFHTRPDSAWHTDNPAYCMTVSESVCVCVHHTAGGPLLVENLHHKHSPLATTHPFPRPPNRPPAVSFWAWTHTALCRAAVYIQIWMVPPTILEFNSEGLRQFRQIYKGRGGLFFFLIVPVWLMAVVGILRDNTMCSRHWLLIISMWRLRIYLTRLRYLQQG